MSGLDATRPAIEVQRLGHRFGSRTVLEQVHFTVAAGRITGLLGPNGAGKTTLLRCLVGTLTPDHGRCLIAGVDPRLDPVDAAAHVGFMPDQPPLEGDLRVDEYLRLHGRLRGLSGQRLETRLEAVLDLVDLTARRRHLAQTLSRGQRSRLGLAEALLHEPAVLILDEPAAGLDPAQVVALRHLLRRLAGRHTVLIATHHLAEAEAVCDDLVVLVEGRVRAQGTPAALAADRTLEAAYLDLAGAGA